MGIPTFFPGNIEIAESGVRLQNCKMQNIKRTLQAVDTDLKDIAALRIQAKVFFLLSALPQYVTSEYPDQKKKNPLDTCHRSKNDDTSFKFLRTIATEGCSSV